MDSKTPLHSESDLPSSRRFNPTAIGRRPPVLPHEDLRAAPLPAGNHLSRRAFLSLSGLATVGGVLHTNAQPFSILREGRRLHIALDAERRWTIDPDHFGPLASTRVRHAPRTVTLSLRNAFFPGTDLPADFVCVLREVNGSWRILLRMFGGKVLAANLVDWLRGEPTGAVPRRNLLLKIVPHLSLRSLVGASVRFTPDWTLHASGDLRTHLSIAETGFASRHATVRLDADTAVPALAANKTGPRTLIELKRGTAAWPLDLTHQSPHGWGLSHEQELFESLSVEAVGHGKDAVRTAAFTAAPDATLQFRPGGDLRDALHQPVALTLERIRLLHALDDEPQSMLLGSLRAAGEWVHGRGFSMLVGAHPDGKDDEFILQKTGATTDKHFSAFRPGVLKLQVHGGAGVRISVQPDASLRRPWAWSTNIQGAERVLAALHLDPWEHHLHFDLEAGDRIRLLNTTRQMDLTFAFQRMRLHFPFLGHPVIRPTGPSATFTIILPPQYTAPQAFFAQEELDPQAPLKEMQDTLSVGDVETHKGVIQKSELDPDTQHTSPTYSEIPYIGIKSRSAGVSQLVYDILPGESVPCSEKGLLDVKRFKQKLAEVATWDASQPFAQPVDPQIYPFCDSGGTLGNCATPQEQEHVTAIEMPWRLYLSPTGNEAWIHEAESDDYDTGIFELWHSRLGVVTQSPSQPYVPAPSQPMTARAIWTPGFNPTAALWPHKAWASATGTAPEEPNNLDEPFRMALDRRDRTELVHLTSNVALRAPADKTITATAPLRIDQWIVSAMGGGYLRGAGSWNPPRLDPIQDDIQKTLTVEHWADITVLGHPVFDEVDYKGYLLPFGHRASLAKVTEKRSKMVDGKVFYFDTQHMYIKISNKDRTYPLTGQPYDGLGFNFSRVEALTARTPDLVNPDSQDRTDIPGGYQKQSLFWPSVVEGQPFLFNFRMYHKDGTTCESSAAVAFAGADIAQTTAGAREAVGFYNHAEKRVLGTLSFNPVIGNACVLPEPGPGKSLGGVIKIRTGAQSLELYVASGASLERLKRQIDATAWFQINGVTASLGANALTLKGAALDLTGTNLGIFGDTGYVVESPRRTSDFAGRKVLFATAGKPGDTQFDCASITWRADASDPAVAQNLYEQDLPFFYPATHHANVVSASTRRIAPLTTAATVAFYQPYLEAGFDLRRNRGEVFLEVLKNPSRISFSDKVDQSGGLVSPDSLTVGYARAAGPVGGRLEDVAAAALLHQMQLEAALFPSAPVPFAPHARHSRVQSTSSSTQSSLAIHATGSFDPSTFFGGLSSARILAGIKLSDVISFLVNAVASTVGGPPRMVEQLLYLADDAADVLGKEEKQAIDLIHQIQDFTIPGGSRALAASLAPEAHAVDDAYAQLQQLPPNATVIQKGTVHAVLIAALIAYATRLESKLASPGQLAQQILMEQIESALGQLLPALKTTLKSVVGEVVTALPTPSDLDNLLAATANALEAYKAMAQTEIVDPLKRLGQDAIKEGPAMTTFAALEPEFNAVLDILPIVDDLRTRSKTLPSGLAVAKAMLPILDDLLRVGDRLGVLHCAADLQAQATNVQQALTTAFAARPLEGLLDVFAAKAWIFAEQLSQASAEDLEVGRQALQAYNQLRSAYKRLSDATQLIESTLNDDRGKWAVTQAKRRYKQVVLTSLQTLHTLALQQIERLPAPQPPLINAAQELLAAFLLADPLQPGQFLWLPSRLIEVDFTASLNSIYQLQQQYLPALDALQQTLEIAYNDVNVLTTSFNTAVNAVVATPPGAAGYQTLSAAVIVAQNQLLTGVLQLQQPFALAYEYQLYTTSPGDAYQTVATGLEELKQKAAPFVTVYEKVGAVACAQINNLLTAWTPLSRQIQQLQQAQPSTPASLAATVLATQIAAVDQAVAEFQASFQSPATCSRSLSQAMHHLHHILATLQDLVDAVTNEFAHLAQDAREFANAALQVLQLRNLIPPPLKLRLHLDWKPTLKSCEPVFLLRKDAALTVSAESIITLPVTGVPPTPAFNITSTLTNFSINLIGHPSFVIVDIEHFHFTASAGHQPNCDLRIANVRFGEDMSFVAGLAKLLSPKQGPFLDFIPDGVLAGFRFNVPDIQVGAFNMRQLSLNVGVNLPFSGKPVRCIFGISTQDHPFQLSVGIYGGGGFLQLYLGLDGVEILEGALEFGLMGAVTILVLSGWGKIVAGIYFRIERNMSRVCGFFHAHGHFDIFGIVSMDIDLKVIICYDSDGKVKGEADFSVDIDILFFSVSYSFHASYEFGGSPAEARTIHGAPTPWLPAPNDPTQPLKKMPKQKWAEYLKRFAPAELGKGIHA